MTRALPDPRRLARFAGVLYLAIIALGLSGELAVRGVLIVPGDAAATAAAIRADPGLFRLGIAADALMAVCDVGLAVLLFVLLRPAGPVLALAAMVFRLVQAAVIAANLLSLHWALTILLDGLGPDALAAGMLGLHAVGYDVGLIFFGVNSLLVGVLLVRAEWFPAWLGIGIGAAGLVYLAGSTLRLLAPGWVEAFAPAYLVCIVAELAFALWLLLRGIDRARWPVAG